MNEFDAAEEFVFFFWAIFFIVDLVVGIKVVGEFLGV